MSVTKTFLSTKPSSTVNVIKSDYTAIEERLGRSNGGNSEYTINQYAAYTALTISDRTVATINVQTALKVKRL